jgi:hypothetical protein
MLSMVKLEILMACVFYKEPHHEFIAQRSEPKITGRGHRPSVMDAGVSLTRAIRVVREALVALFGRQDMLLWMGRGRGAVRDEGNGGLG